MGSFLIPMSGVADLPPLPPCLGVSKTSRTIYSRSAYLTPPRCRGCRVPHHLERPSMPCSFHNTKVRLNLLEGGAPLSAQRSALSVVTFTSDRHRYSGEQLANVLTSQAFLCYYDEDKRVSVGGGGSG